MADSTVHSVPRTQSYAMYNPNSIRLRRLLLPLVLMGVDYAALIAAVWTAFFIRTNLAPKLVSWPFQAFDIPSAYMYAVIPFAFIFFIHFARLYTRRLLFWQQAEQLFKASIYAIVMVLVLMYITGDAGEISRIFLVTAWVTGFLYLTISQYLAKKVLFLAGLWQIPVVIVGAGKTAELLINAFENDTGLGYKVAGLIEDNLDSELRAKYPVIRTFDNAENAVKRAGVKDVMIAAPGLKREGLLDMVYRLQPYVDNITFVPDLFGVPVGAMELDTLFNEKAVLLRIRNNLANNYNRLLKRFFDLICSVVGTIVILPVLAAIAVAIYLDNPGPIVFAHTRIGKDGKTFPCYKFRSMITNAQAALEKYLEDNPEARKEWERDFKLKDDPRITRIGAFLRKTSLDELPQLFNVIRGEMSLVGPRPIVNDEVVKYGNYIYDYYLVRPGITGMWQVSGRNDVNYDERVQLDSWYVRNWSLWQDVVLLFRTVTVVIKGKGAY